MPEETELGTHPSEVAEEQVTETHETEVQETPVEEQVSAQTEGEVEAQQAWQPTYKYVVDGAEHEFDEPLKQVIKTPEIEEKLRDLYQRGHGIEAIKGRHNELKTEHQQVREAYEQAQKTSGQLNTYLKENDLKSFFTELGVPKEKVYQYVLDELNYNQLPPEQRQVVDQHNEQARQLRLLEEQNQMLRQQNESQSVHSRTAELDSVLTRPEVKSAMTSFDSRVGQPGAFRSEVIKRGIAEWSMTGKDLSAEQAVSEVMRFVPTEPATSAATSQAQAPVQERAKPVIPNIHGSNASPVKSKVRSIDDLKKLAASMPG